MTVPPSESGKGVAIRPAERADLLDVFRIEKASFPQPWPYSAFERFLDDPGFLVADGGTAEADVLGYAVQDVTPNHGRDIGHLKDLAVRPADRGQGVGRRLLGRSLARMRESGATVAKLEVRASNDPALALYRDAGFEAARRIPRYYEDGEDAFLMTRDLERV
ncbi:MAG: ribosomal protein S18-alanine N-acetyltransferase [Haloferacaceae archaeon]